MHENADPHHRWYMALFQDTKADVILKYNADEARSLKAYGELPEHGIRRPVLHVCLKDLLMKCFVTHEVSFPLSISLSQAKINETDTFGPGDDDEIQFDDIGDDDEDIDDVSANAESFRSRRWRFKA